MRTVAMDLSRFLYEKNTFRIAFDKQPSFLGIDFVNLANDGHTFTPALEI
jgi:hypothetical protein